MAITRTQIAKQLLANGGRTGFQRGGRRGDTGQASQSVSDSFRDVGGSDFGQFERRTRQNETLKNAGFLNRDLGINVGPQKNVFQKLADLSLVKKGIDTFADFLDGPDFETTKPGGGLDLPLWARLGFSSQEDYEAALRSQMLMADGGRIGFFKGAQADTAKGEAMSPGTTAAGGFRDSSGGPSGGGGGGDIITTPEQPVTIVEPKKSNIQKIKDFFGLSDDDDDDEKSLQETLAGAITNQPEFQSKIDATVSGIMANPDLAGLGPITQGKADGGPIGGIMDLETGRQQYFLGKLVKKVGRTVKKIAKSPLGKAALAGAALYYGRGFLKDKGIMGTLFGQAGSRVGQPFVPFKEGILPKLGLTQGGGSLMPTVLGGISLASTVAGLLTPEQEAEAQRISDETGIDIEEIRANPDKYLAIAFRAEGGRIGYQEGSKEPVAKKTMPLLDMGGKEMDLREEGGFVPIGRMEKADDVPARLSKNEFVFTADAVRNAGEGDVDKGAEVMYNMMKNLEAGGEVSEESQGLEGARKMFQTSQRLEEVL